MDADHELRARWDQESMATIGEISKQCPGCGTKTEKDGKLLAIGHIGKDEKIFKNKDTITSKSLRKKIYLYYFSAFIPSAVSTQRNLVLI